MPSTCCVPGCFNVGGFSFPKNKDLKQKWIVQVCREDPGKKKWSPNPDDRICELHFDPEDIVMHMAVNSDRIWRTVRPGAVPRKPNEDKKESTPGIGRAAGGERVLWYVGTAGGAGVRREQQKRNYER